MAERSLVLPILSFCLRFVVLTVALTMLWWFLLPYYGWFLVQVCGGILKYGFGLPIQSGHIERAGFFNTDSLLVFVLPERSPKLPLAHLITNVGPFWALVWATPKLTLRRRLVISVQGSGILILGHILFVVLALPFQDVVRTASEIPTAIVQFFLTLPFLLWVILAYWDKLVAYLNDVAGTRNNADEKKDPSADE